MDTPWTERYQTAWARFVDEVSAVHALAGEQPAAGAQAPYHEALRHVYDVPYHQLLRLAGAVPCDNGSKRVGSTCGFFLENLVAAMVSGALRRQCERVRVARNGYLIGTPAGCPKEPDIYVEHCHRRIVFEVKAQVFSDTLKASENIKQRYEACGLDYYLIAGWTSASRACLEEYSQKADWMTVLAGGKDTADCLSRFPTFDDILGDAGRCDMGPGYQQPGGEEGRRDV